VLTPLAIEHREDHAALELASDFVTESLLAHVVGVLSIFLELGDEFNLVQPKAEECAAAATGRGGPNDGSDGAPRNTTIALVATDAPLFDLEAERMAQIANAGLARSIRPIHGIGDGDTVFGMATTLPTTQMSNGDLQAIFNAGADVLGRAVVHAVLMSKQVGTSRAGYCQQYPSACVKRTGAGK
jgi:L-aminopeptidase/D-esterase-like protein